MEGVSSNLFSIREEGPSAASPSGFRQDCEFPTGAALLKFTVGSDVFCTLRSRSARRRSGIWVVPRSRSFVPFLGWSFFYVQGKTALPCSIVDFQEEYRDERKIAENQRRSN